VNNLIKITIVLLALTAVILTVSCACKVQTPKPEPVKTQPVPEVTISDDELGLRKGTLMNEELVVPQSEMKLAEAGKSQVIDRSFENAPPMIPHNIAEFVPVTLKSNMCLDCHDPEIAADMEATSVPASHMYDIRNDKQLDKLSGANYNCTLCHATVTDAKPLVRNSFKAEYRNDASRNSSSLLEDLNEGVR